MLVALDTNHLTEWVQNSEIGLRLQEHCHARGAVVFTSIITSQESAEGWFAWINRRQPGQDQVPFYELCQRSLNALQEMGMLAFDYEAALRFEALKSQRLRVGTMDLKIAAICLANDAVLLSRNLVDFEKIPDLRIENWFD